MGNWGSARMLDEVGGWWMKDPWQEVGRVRERLDVPLIFLLLPLLVLTKPSRRYKRLHHESGPLDYDKQEHGSNTNAGCWFQWVLISSKKFLTRRSKKTKKNPQDVPLLMMTSKEDKGIRMTKLELKRQIKTKGSLGHDLCMWRTTVVNGEDRLSVERRVRSSTLDFK